MRENRPSGSEGGGTEPNPCSRPLSSLASLNESNPRAMRNRGDDRCGANRPREIITSFLPAHRILLPPHPDPLTRNDPVSALDANSGGEGAKAPLRDGRCGSCFDAIANSLRLMFQLYKSGTYWRTIPSAACGRNQRDEGREARAKGCGMKNGVQPASWC